MLSRHERNYIRRNLKEEWKYWANFGRGRELYVSRVDRILSFVYFGVETVVEFEERCVGK